MYSLTNDHPVSTDDGPSSIRGCQVFQLNVFPSDQVWQFQVAQRLRWVGGWGGGNYSDYNVTLWPYLASKDFQQDFQL